MLKVRNERIKLFKRLYPFLKQQKLLYFALGCFKVFFLLFSLAPPLLYMILINDVMVDKKLYMLIWVVAGYVGIYLLQTLATVLNKITYNTLFIKFNLRLKAKILFKYIKMETSDYNGYDVGDLKNRMEGDIGVFEKFLNSHCLDYLYALISALTIAVILLFMNRILALFGFLMAPLSFQFAKVMGKKAGKISNEYRENYGKYESFLHSSLQNWKEVKVNSLERHESQILTRHWDKLSKLFVKNQIFWYINRSFVAFKDFFITKMNLYFIGGLLIINGHMEVAALLIFMNYYEQFFANILSITDLILGLKMDKPSIDRVLKIVDYPESNKLEVTQLTDEIKIEDVSFSYPNTDAFVLRNISLTVFPHQHIAIVGKSGCGKTTLSRLMVGLYPPDSGKIYLGGYDIQTIGYDSIGHKIGVVMQESIFFNLTVRENLQLAKKRATKDELDTACKKANIFDFIQELPEKYESVIGEKGIKLSGGQKQRLAIARTILFDPDIIIFDEATSLLDHESEKMILSSIKFLSKNKTVITIAHRLSSVLNSDCVVVMDAGEVIEIGRHEDLKDKNKIYDLLFKKQYQMG
jgi:ATP-binding cassette subfamily B protein/subfamily B ATP-binding cassette protein MsbA